MSKAVILDAKLVTKIRELCYQGYVEYDERDYRRALRTFYQAWLLVPKPQTDWREAGWVLTAIGDAYFRTHQYNQAVEALRSALLCPAAKQSPFIHLRIGQSLFEMGDDEKAHEMLQKAHSLGGGKVFAKEAPKYRRVLDLVV
jgi:tetratricopeptide (TPR) repeat protein